MKSQFLLLVFSIYGCVAFDVGSVECNKGPEFWCADLKAAKSCGAVKYCIQNVWEKMKLPEDNNEVCDICKKMVQQARDQLLSNETQEEIREVLEGTCHIYFPVKFLADECVKFVDEYIPELIEMLASRMDPQTVCATAGLCNAASLQVKFFTKHIKQFVPKPTQCFECKRYMQRFHNEINKSTKEQVQTKLIDLCNKMVPIANECRDVVVRYFDQIYKVLANDMTPDETCLIVSMCDDTNRHTPVMMSVIDLFLEQRGDTMCDFCEQLLQHLKDMLTSNSTEEEFKDALLGICKQLGSFEKQCEDFVNKNFNLIYDFIVNELDPHTLCYALGLCPKLVAENVKSFPAARLTPAEKISDESNDVDSVPLTNINPSSVKVKLPSSKRIPQVIQALPATRYVPQTLTRSTIGCALCEYALHEIQNLLQDNKTEASIKHAVETVCTVLPKTLADECKSFIEVYGDAIIALIAQEIDPSVVCVKLGLCGSEITAPHVETKFPMSKLRPALKIVPSIIRPNVKTDVCGLCQTVVDLIDVALQDNGTRQEIENAVDSLCQELPQQYQADCKAYVDETLEQLFETFQQTDPKTICTDIFLCSQKTLGIPIRKTELRNDLKMDGCQTCQTIVNYLEKLLEDDRIEKDVTKLFEKVCEIVPKSIQQQCKSYIDTYGPYIMQMLGALADSEQICEAIKMCSGGGQTMSKPTGFVQMKNPIVGQHKCTFGPSYWCMSEENAKACQAEEHCKKFVWKN